MSEPAPDGDAEVTPVEPAQTEPARAGAPKYLLPRSWVVRVVVAWVAGLIAMVLAHAILGGERSYTFVAFWTLVLILIAFGVSDWRRKRP